MDDDRREAPTAVLAVVAGLLAGIGLGAGAMLVWVGDTDLDDPAPVSDQSTVAGAEGPHTDPDPTTTGAGASKMERCASAAQALRAPLEAAKPALEQWEVHIEAMNQLVVGEITLQQASAFWNRTRVGAQRRVDHFNDAWTAVRREGVDCPSPLLLAPAGPAVRPCVRQVAAEIRVLQAARTSIRMWDQHVQDMDMLRMGMLSPDKATAMWLSMWERGARDLDTYRAAARENRAEDGCPEAPSSG